MRKEMKLIVRKTLIENKICNEKNVEAMIVVLNLRSEKLDKCGKEDCNHEHLIPYLLADLISNKNKEKPLSPKIDRLEREKREILQKRKAEKGG